MNSVRVNKAHLLTKLKENREKHRAIFLEALEGYRKEAIRQLEAQLARAKSSKKFTVYINLTQPSDQTKDYDRAIGMLNMSLDTEIALSEQDYKNYVLDDWTWKSQFLASNSAYSATAAGQYADQLGELEADAAHN